MAAQRKRGRLSRSGDFDRVYREGSSHANRFFVLYCFPRGRLPDGGVRLGVSVGRRVGGSVQRNRVKRAVREAFWKLDAGPGFEYDFVVVARPDSAGLVEREGTTGVEAALSALVAEAAREDA